MSFRIRTYNNIATQGLALLTEAGCEVGAAVDKPDAIILRSQKLHDEPIADSVLAVARAGAGVNNIPIDRFTAAGTPVFNTPGANANAVKELVAASLFLASRDILGGANYAQSLAGVDDATEMSKLLESEKKRFAGSEVQGKVLGVVGLGAIGSMVANMALDLGMQVIGYDPAISVEAAWRLSSRVRKSESLQDLLGEVDFLTLHVPDIEQTRGLINDESIGWMKSGVRILNFARERIVDTTALVAGIEAGQVASYVSDFPSPQLLGRSEILVMPHIGASTTEAEENCAVMAARQLLEFLQQGTIDNAVNFPRVQMGHHGGQRITFTNQNVPKVLGDVLGVLADSSINVIDLVNKSRDTIAYNIVDIEQAASADVINAIKQVDHVISVRVLS